MTNDLQTAIERCRDFVGPGWVDVENASIECVADLLVLARAYLRDNPPDGSEPVTEQSEAWLRSLGGLPSGDVTPVELGWKIWERGVTESYGEEPAMHLMWSSVDNSWWLEAYDTGGDTLASIELDPRPTRADVRKLFKALSVATTEAAP